LEGARPKKLLFFLGKDPDQNCGFFGKEPDENCGFFFVSNPAKTNFGFFFEGVRSPTKTHCGFFLQGVRPKQTAAFFSKEPDQNKLRLFFLRSELRTAVGANCELQDRIGSWP
jgi:hypothetical protein